MIFEKFCRILLKKFKKNIIWKNILVLQIWAYSRQQTILCVYFPNFFQELLSVLTQCNSTPRDTHRQRMSSSQPTTPRSFGFGWWGSASRLPADSRVPKSSSVPSRLTSGSENRPSKAAAIEKAENETKCEEQKRLVKEETQGWNF